MFGLSKKKDPSHSNEEALTFLARGFEFNGTLNFDGTVRIDGDRFVGAGIAAVARLHRSLALLAGYDDGSESARAGVVIDWRGVELATGVFQHPVLGMSQAVSIACFR